MAERLGVAEVLGMRLRLTAVLDPGGERATPPPSPVARWRGDGGPGLSPDTGLAHPGS